ncbi:hypothetical protein ACFVS2_25595 [Brevibacillus sp. NPDC058079]|uniref:hypothetical protein n=1 Tax=Brevibacillus sp. NPDC058079 TaxID=3346330 RepID=UPI0036E5CC2B
MWEKRVNRNNGYGDYGFVRIISEDYTVWQDNAEVILVDHFPMAKEGETKVLMTKWIIRFTEHFGDGEKEEEWGELKEEYVSHYGEPPNNITDIAFYCADGWSRWNAIERIENPTVDEIKQYLNKHGVERVCAGGSDCF